MPHNRDETGQAYIDPGPFDRAHEGESQPETIYTAEDLAHATENAQAVIGHLVTVLHHLAPGPTLKPWHLEEYTEAMKGADIVIETMLDLIEGNAEE